MAITVRILLGAGNGNGKFLNTIPRHPLLTHHSRHYPDHGGRNGHRKAPSTEGLLHHAACLEHWQYVNPPSQSHRTP
jgi:hypothetical protein